MWMDDDVTTDNFRWRVPGLGSGIKGSTGPNRGACGGVDRRRTDADTLNGRLNHVGKLRLQRAKMTDSKTKEAKTT